jgi:hypothetical protein
VKKKLVILDLMANELFVLTADKYDGEGKLVVDGQPQEFRGTEWRSHARVPGGKFKALRFADANGLQFLVIGEKEEVRVQ